MAAERDSEKVAYGMAVMNPRHRPPVGRGAYHCVAADLTQWSTALLCRTAGENGSE
jgi:hypothetical protein